MQVSVYQLCLNRGFPGDSVVKNPPAMQKLQEALVRSQCQENPLAEGMATHSRILAWRIPWMKEPGGSMGLQRVGHDWSDSAHKHTPQSEWFFYFSFIFISWRLITLQYCSGFCHTLTWISVGFTCIPHPNPSSHLPLYPIPLSLPSAPGPSTWIKSVFKMLFKKRT